MSSSHDRRVHKVFVTRNTEYHVRKDLCIAVRDRRSGEWLGAHLARGREVRGSLRFLPTGGVMPFEGVPRIGDSLFFHGGGRDLVTSVILSVERPPKDIVSKY